ncbi:winged helix-turn-helix domain-containing protein [Lutimaribacter marinistellae]|uniref:Winged helix-turn-helix domain-containing protein n=1 Tax=Lutimaribacter marinistellae TaxID=1820329 RepID=A0ABV7TFZ4_9RHOB
MNADADTPRLKLRIVFGSAGMIGPGKAELLERIGQTGSIAAAGRDMGMSYRRAWQLVETMNAMFSEPLVLRVRGGASGGGASLTETGRRVLDEYRGIEDAARAAGQAGIARLNAMLREPDPTN